MSIPDLAQVWRVLPEGWIVVDTDRLEVLHANPAAQRVWGVDVGAALLDHVADVASVQAFLQVAHRGSALLPSRWRWRNDAGSEWRWARCHAARIESGDGRSAVVARLGTSEGDRRLTRLNQELSAARRVLVERRRQADAERRMYETQKLESLGVLAGGIAHDFNNLLVAVLGNLGLARAELTPASPVDDCLMDAEDAGRRAAELCRQMLAYSGRGHFSLEPIDLSALVREMLRLLKVSLNKGAVLRPMLAEGLPAVLGDATQVRQVVMNLVTNASDAVGSGDGLVSVSTQVRRADRAWLDTLSGGEQLAEGRYVQLEVSDSGVGMDPDVVERMFEPFFTTKFAGRGLGLAAVQGIVRGHGGALRVYSEKGHGTTVRVLFPVAASDEDAQASEVPAELPPHAGTVLVVDDEPMVRKLAQRALTRAGYGVLEAEDGVEALRLVERHHAEIRAVLLDLTMPRMGGDEVFRQLRRIAPDLRVLITSGYSAQDTQSRLVGRGMAAFLEKPWTPAELVAAIGQALA